MWFMACGRSFLRHLRIATRSFNVFFFRMLLNVNEQLLVRWWIGTWNLPFITSSLLLWYSLTGKLFGLTGLVFFMRNMFMSLFLLYSSRNDCRRRRSEREKVINFRQKEKDILDSIIGMSLIFYPKNHKKTSRNENKGSYKLRRKDQTCLR